MHHSVTRGGGLHKHFEILYWGLSHTNLRIPLKQLFGDPPFPQQFGWTKGRGVFKKVVLGSKTLHEALCNTNIRGSRKNQMMEN